MTIVNKKNILDYFYKRFNTRIVVRCSSDLVEYYRGKLVPFPADFKVDQLPYRFREDKSIIEPQVTKEGEVPYINPDWIDGKYEMVVAHPYSEPSKFQVVLYDRGNT